MKQIVLCSVLLLSGCSFAKWATTPRENGSVPALEAGEEIGSGALTGFEKGGIVAGVLGLLFTTAKTGLRLYKEFQDSKEVAEIVLSKDVSGGAP